MRRTLITLLALVLIAAPWAAGAIHHGGMGQPQNDHTLHGPAAHASGQLQECSEDGCDGSGGKGCCEIVAVHCAGFFTGVDGSVLPVPIDRTGRWAASGHSWRPAHMPEADTPPPRV